MDYDLWDFRSNLNRKDLRVLGLIYELTTLSKNSQVANISKLVDLLKPKLNKREVSIAIDNLYDNRLIIDTWQKEGNQNLNGYNLTPKATMEYTIFYISP